MNMAARRLSPSQVPGSLMHMGCWQALSLPSSCCIEKIETSPPQKHLSRELGLGKAMPKRETGSDHLRLSIVRRAQPLNSGSQHPGSQHHSCGRS